MKTVISPAPSSNLALVKGLILAGGLSSRMGDDKALLLFEGIPLLSRVCLAAGDAVTELQILTPWPERYGHLALAGATFRQEERHEPPRGPLAALAEGLRQSDSPWLLLLACDLPYLDGKILRTWATQLLETPTIQAALPSSTQGWEPLCGFYHQRCLPQLENYLAENGRSFKGWLPQIGIQPLLGADERFFFNCNNPAQMEDGSKRLDA